MKAAQTSGAGPSRTPLIDANPAEVKEPIAEMFERARSALDDESCDVRLEFDPRDGHLSSYYADCGEEGALRAVECLVSDTLDLTACPYE